ncbi:MAG: AbrB/MazE/SpoVT family DNA-binding domain-containing protein [Thermoplasmata archaeon]|nr:AbrB/MazE/SpoVT family DNA-binding domain-containing protein [Thermoplasmata archaeon]
MRTQGGYHGRRIQKTGGSTFIVSLPKAWVTSRNLGAGDVLMFVPRPDGSLLLYADSGPAGEATKRTVLVSNDMSEDHLFRRLVAEYIAGAPLLEIRTSGRMQARTRNVVRGFAQRMIGPEILEETSEAVVLQDVVGANPLPIPQVIRRMHQMVRAMQADAMAAFRTQDAGIAKDVMERDWEVDRLHWFVQKQVTTALRDARTLTSLGLTLPECATYLLASRVMERIADHAVRIASTVAVFGKEKPPPSVVAELEGLATGASQSLTTALEALEGKKVDEANEVVDAAERLARQREKILQELATKRGRVAVGLAYVLESLERSALYAADLAEIAINHAVELGEPKEPAAPARRGESRAPALATT